MFSHYIPFSSHPSLLIKISPPKLQKKKENLISFRPEFLLGPQPKQQCGENVSLPLQLRLRCTSLLPRALLLATFHLLLLGVHDGGRPHWGLVHVAAPWKIKNHFYILLLNIQVLKKATFPLWSAVFRVCIGLQFLFSIGLLVCQPALYPPEFSFSLQSLCVFVSLRWNADALMERRALPVQGVWEGPHTPQKHT